MRKKEEQIMGKRRGTILPRASVAENENRMEIRSAAGVRVCISTSVMRRTSLT